MAVRSRALQDQITAVVDRLLSLCQMPVQHGCSRHDVRRRGFCSACGTPLAYESERFPGEVHFHISTCDDPDSLPPSFHVWHEEWLVRLETADSLPRHAEFSG